MPGHEPARRQVRDGGITHFATIDHAFCLARDPDLLALRLAAAHPCSVADLRVPSGHRPTRQSFGQRRQGYHRFRAPDHVAEREDFGERVWPLFDLEGHPLT